MRGIQLPGLSHVMSAFHWILIQIQWLFIIFPSCRWPAGGDCASSCILQVICRSLRIPNTKYMLCNRAILDCLGNIVKKKRAYTVQTQLSFQIYSVQSWLNSWMQRAGCTIVTSTLEAGTRRHRGGCAW